MLLRPQRLARISRSAINSTPWRRLLRCPYSTAIDDTQTTSSANPNDSPEWFQRLRKEMLNRELPSLKEVPSVIQEDKLAATLSLFLPAGFKPAFRTKSLENGESRSHTIGNHLVFFNPIIPTNELLPDGTDRLHSPALSDNPFKRRMWAGGSVKVRPLAYFQPTFENGWDLNRPHMCVERIKDVSLRGQGVEAKILVVVERRFASVQALEISMAAHMYKGPGGVAEFFQQQARKEEKWGDAYLLEERYLVFMHEKSQKEIEASTSGEAAPIKYLKAPGSPDFSHSTKPTRDLLSRFSALTFNSHAIHLDQQYCKEIEGHHNTLVHGPLTLMLMLKFIASHLDAMTGPPRIIKSINYKNLAPLYATETLRLCARERSRTILEGDIEFDVWIEGPVANTMAVKGTVVCGFRPTAIRPVDPGLSSSRPIEKEFINGKYSAKLADNEYPTLPESLLPIVPRLPLMRTYHSPFSEQEGSDRERKAKPIFQEKGARLVYSHDANAKLRKLSLEPARAEPPSRQMHERGGRGMQTTLI